jgi:hypothetical protein
VWKFCFGDDGEEQQVLLTHSVVSGKKVRLRRLCCLHVRVVF